MLASVCTVVWCRVCISCLKSKIRNNAYTHIHAFMYPHTPMHIHLQPKRTDISEHLLALTLKLEVVGQWRLRLGEEECTARGRRRGFGSVSALGRVPGLGP